MPDIGYESLFSQLENLLVRPLRSIELSTTIVIDALDECEDDKPASAVLSVLARFIHVIPSVKFFITGRPELPIRGGFRLPLLKPHTEVFLLHKVDQTRVARDIEHYLRVHLSELVSEGPWPTDQHIITMVKKCSGLFIIAYIIVKFVASRHHQPQQRLELIVGNPDDTNYEGKSGIDAMYHQILERSFKDIDLEDDFDVFERLRSVVGAIVLAVNPLSRVTLAAILNITQSQVQTAMHSLHSIFLVPDSESEPIRICHKSVADFFTSRTRCTDPRFFINPSSYHLKLGTGCLVLMDELLTTNICKLPDYAMNKDIHDLDERRKRYIGDALDYACRSWARHLLSVSRASDSHRLVELLDSLFKRNLLSWLEVLSVVGDLRCAVYSLRNVKAWLSDVSSVMSLYFLLIEHMV
jgi:hypothetical protein